jgi:hypothetical protein
MSRHGGVSPAPPPAVASLAAVPSGYIVWRVGPAWYARSNVHREPGAAAAAGIPWFVIAWSPADLFTALSAGEASHGEPG